MKQSSIERRISDLVEPLVAAKGYELICVTMQGADLQIMAENPATRNLGVDECALLSREIAAVLDVEDPIKGRYRLEVSSPGIDRPLVKLQDFVDFAGFEAKIEVIQPMEGQKRFRGRIKGVESKDGGESEILLETDTGLACIPFGALEKAKLVLTDDLLRKKAPQSVI